MLFRRKNRQVPGLNTASLPDMIFTVLFFFMIVTHLRDTDVHVDYQLPEGTQVEKLAKNRATAHVFIGSPAGTQQPPTTIQLEDRIVPLAHLAAEIRALRASLTKDEAAQFSVTIKADRRTPMAVVTAVKKELRKIDALKISYSADKPKPADARKRMPKP